MYVLFCIEFTSRIFSDASHNHLGALPILTWPGSAHAPLRSLLLPLPHLRLDLGHLLQVLLGRRLEPEDEQVAGVEEDVVDEGDGEEDHDEDPAVVHDDVLEEVAHFDLSLFPSF